MSILLCTIDLCVACTPTDRARRECIVYPNKFSGVLAHLYKDWPSAQAASTMCEHKCVTQQHLGETLCCNAFVHLTQVGEICQVQLLNFGIHADGIHIL